MTTGEQILIETLQRLIKSMERIDKAGIIWQSDINECQDALKQANDAIHIVTQPQEEIYEMIHKAGDLYKIQGLTNQIKVKASLDSNDLATMSPERRAFYAKMSTFFNDGIKLSKRKNADYCGDSDPFKNLRQVEAIGLSSTLDGILTRMSDKMSRLVSLTRPGTEAQVNDESIRDTLVDLAVYSAIASIWLEWEKQ